MIWESGPWKDDLLRRATQVRQRINQRQWRAASYALVEQDLMLGFYSIRKLQDADKLSDAVIDQSVRLFTFRPFPGKTITKMNWHRLDELYDLSARHPHSRKLRFVCNQLIHSYVFTVVTGDAGGFAGVFFVSDIERRNGLFFIEASEIVRVFESVGSDYPSTVRTQWNPQLADYETSSA